jgi:hypothetical protein
MSSKDFPAFLALSVMFFAAAAAVADDAANFAIASLALLKDSMFSSEIF